MSLKFNDAIIIVAEKLLEVPKPIYQTYLQDVTEISEKMDQELITINSIFKGTVSNWNETAEFFNTEIPKLQAPFLQLKMPFMVEPQPQPPSRVLVFDSDKIQTVNLKTSVNHPAVENGYLNGKKLTELFIWDLNRVIERISKITCRSGKIYKLCIEITDEPIGGLFIKILAKENDQPSISYDFVPYLLFTNNPFGYTNALDSFLQTEQSVNAAKLKIGSKVVQSVEILLLTLGNRSMLSLYDIHSIPLYRPFKSNTVGSALLDALPDCISHLQNPGPLISAYGKLLRFKQSDSVQLTELMAVFGLK